MKNKKTAALLAFFGGFLGLHKFYLQEEGAGVFYLVLSVISGQIGIVPIGALLGVIDCIVLLNMSEADFDQKYNGTETANTTVKPKKGKGHTSSRYERYQERERMRRQRTGRGKSTTSTRSTPSRPAERPKRPKREQAKIQAEIEEGIRYFKDYEFDRAIAAFERVLKLDSANVAAHFNLACAYSAEENADKSFYHIDRAVALGFDDFERIRTHDKLAFLRIQEEFPRFAERGYQLSPQMDPPEVETVGDPVGPINATPPQAAPASGDLLDQLNRLAELREKGLLTEAEFTRQKQRLLG